MVVIFVVLDVFDFTSDTYSYCYRMYATRIACNGLRQGVFRKTLQWQSIQRSVSGPGGRGTLRKSRTQMGQTGTAVPGETGHGVSI